MLICKYCGSERKNDNSLRNHERTCRENPNRYIPNGKKGKKGGNAYTKAKEEGRVYTISDEARKNMSRASSGRKHSEETKQVMSKKAIERGFGGVTQSRWIKYKGKLLGSSYEVKLAEDLDKNNIRWDICRRFNYIDVNGKSRTYTPDIYLIDFDIYLDPKNDFLIENVNPRLGFKDCDKIKWVMEQNDVNIFILNSEQLCWGYIKNNLLG